MTKGEELARQLVNCNITTMMGSRYYFVPYSLARDIVEALKDCKEHKTGKWVLTRPLQEDDEGAYVCSCCKSGSWEVLPSTWKVCPWCGATMEGVKK